MHEIQSGFHPIDPVQFCTSGVPQNVVVVLLSSSPSLQRPKSVRTMWPCESSRIFSGFRSLFKKIKEFSGCIIPVNGLSADVMTADGHRRALQDRSLPVDDVQRVEVAQCACDLGSIEPGSGLQENPLPLEMVEKL